MREVIIHIQYEDGSTASVTMLIPVAEHAFSYSYNNLPQSIDTNKITGLVVRVLR